MGGAGAGRLGPHRRGGEGLGNNGWKGEGMAQWQEEKEGGWMEEEGGERGSMGGSRWWARWTSAHPMIWPNDLHPLNFHV